MTTAENTLVVNPDWKDARYEYRFRYPNGSYAVEMYPVRGNEIVDGKIVPIPSLVTLAEAAKTKRLREAAAKSNDVA